MDSEIVGLAIKMTKDTVQLALPILQNFLREKKENKSQALVLRLEAEDNLLILEDALKKFDANADKAAVFVSVSQELQYTKLESIFFNTGKGNEYLKKYKKKDMKTEFLSLVTNIRRRMKEIKKDAADSEYLKNAKDFNLLKRIQTLKNQCTAERDFLSRLV